jgi:hypothetical protein
VEGELKGKRPIRRPRTRWVDNIKLGLREICWDDMDWIDRAQNMDQWRNLLIAVTKFRVS